MFHVICRYVSNGCFNRVSDSCSVDLLFFKQKFCFLCPSPAEGTSEAYITSIPVFKFTLTFTSAFLLEVIRPNKKKCVFRVTLPYLIFLMKPSNFFSCFLKKKKKKKNVLNIPIRRAEQTV